GFAGLSVVLSFWSPTYLRSLQLAPGPARFGLLALTMGFVALVWERDKELHRMSEELDRQRLLVASFENRLGVLDDLLDACDRVTAPLLVDDVLRAIVETGRELAGAEQASVDLLQDAGVGLDVLRSQTSVLGRPPVEGHSFTMTLRAESLPVAFLRLVLPDDACPLSIDVLAMMERYSAQAGSALSKALMLSDERASVTYLRTLDTVRQRVLGTVSHELRTPLTTVIGNAATLQNHWSRLEEDRKTEFVASIHAQGVRLARMIERLLEAAQLEIGGVAMNPIMHDVRMTVTNAVGHFVASDPGRVELHTPATPLVAEVDPVVVEQVMANLVDNALRFSRGKVRISLEGERDEVVLSVFDEGSGVDRRLLDSRWVASRLPSDDSESGAGLGLHIVTTLVRDHRGRVETAPVRDGSVIRVVLPQNFDRELRAVPVGEAS
ncbi:MAG: ATP-binding protein, partial [Actinomycetota bacterium]|nr:ATP-binding protein [Actinomycetota bacterium]